MVGKPTCWQALLTFWLNCYWCILWPSCFVLLGTPDILAVPFATNETTVQFPCVAQRKKSVFIVAVFAVVFRACKWQFNVMHVPQNLVTGDHQWHLVTGDHLISLRPRLANVIQRTFCRSQPYLILTENSIKRVHENSMRVVA